LRRSSLLWQQQPLAVASLCLGACTLKDIYALTVLSFCLQLNLYQGLPSGGQITAQEKLDGALAGIAVGISTQQPQLVAQAAKTYDQLAAAAKVSKQSWHFQAIDMHCEAWELFPPTLPGFLMLCCWKSRFQWHSMPNMP
jgi:hypothetical protein